MNMQTRRVISGTLLLGLLAASCVAMYQIPKVQVVSNQAVNYVEDQISSFSADDFEANPDQENAVTVADAQPAIASNNNNSKGE